MTIPTSWARGYPVSELYPPSWHHFQSPAHLRAICALNGVVWDVAPQTPLHIAEIGCATGYTAAMLAAGTPQAQVLGLDYNAAHIAEARSLAAASGLDNLRYMEADLAEMSDAEIDKLPEFDLVTAHGLWSWVADPVREGLLRLLRRRLKPGGLALVSYNVLPGAAGSLGLARLVRGSLLAHGTSAEGVAAASDLVKRLVAAQATHLPQSGWRRMLMGEVKEVRPGYLLHEFLTEHWRPSFFADVASAMSSARCDYVGSASIDENFPAMTLSAEQQAIFNEAPDEASRQLIVDLCVPRAFRRDVYVRGLRRTPRDAAVDAIWMASTNRSEGDVVLKSQAGEAKLPPGLLSPVRAALADGPQTIGALRALSTSGTVTPGELLAVLVGGDCAQPMWCAPGTLDDASTAAVAARRFNHQAARRLVPHGVGANVLGLASPWLGGGMRVSALELAIVGLLSDDAAGTQLQTQPDAAAFVRRLLPPGDGPAPEIVEALERSVARLLAERLPVWRALAII
jgi:SAM-dependent methyltransferase